MDYTKYVVLWLWFGPVFFLAASIRRYLYFQDPISYILDIVASITFFIGLLGTLIGECLGELPLDAPHLIMDIVYIFGPVFYFISSLGRLGKWKPSLIADIIDILCTICFFVASSIGIILEIKKPRSRLHIFVLFTYWLGPCVLVSAVISYAINDKSKISNYLEISSASLFTFAASIWLIGEILTRNGIITLEDPNNQELMEDLAI